MTHPAAPAEVVVVGSVNVDLVAQVTDLPLPGQTVLATSYAEFPGGKGGNQAIAAARLGRRVAFVGRTGDDAAGTWVRSVLAGEHVDVAELKSLAGEATGRAMVIVDTRAENSIVVIGGANAALRVEHVDGAAGPLHDAAVVVAQLEVPVEAVRAAARHARGTFVFNPAPAQRLDDELMRLVDVLVVNEGEFETLTGHPVGNDLAALTARLRDSALPRSVVVTLGRRGALVCRHGEMATVPAPIVSVVDTTGAGDTFVGALADALARGEELPAAARWAVCAASLSTGSLGATTAMPTSPEVRKLMAKMTSNLGQGKMAESKAPP